MAINMPQTVKTQTNVTSAQNTASDSKAQTPVTFSTANNAKQNTNAQEKTAPVAQSQSTETAKNEATAQPQTAAKPVTQGSAKTVTPSATQNENVQKPVVEKQTVAQPQVEKATPATKASVNNNSTVTPKAQVEQNVQKPIVENNSAKTSDNIVTPKATEQNVEVKPSANNNVKTSTPSVAKESFNTTASEVAPAEKSMEADVKSSVEATANTQANAVKGVASVNASATNKDDSDKDSDKKKSSVGPFLMLASDGLSTNGKAEDQSGTLYGTGNEVKLPGKWDEGSVIETEHMWSNVNGKTADAWCLQPLANGPLEITKSKQTKIDYADVTDQVKGNNELLGVLYYGYQGPKSIVGKSDNDYLMTHIAASVAAWDTNYDGIRDYESNKSKTKYPLSQATIDKWRKLPEVAKLLNAAKGFNQGTLDKDGYTFTAYNGHGVGANGKALPDSQDIFMVSWAKKPAPKPTQAKPTSHNSSKPQSKPTQPAKTQPTQKTSASQSQQKTQPVTQKTQPVTQPISIGTTLVGTNNTHEIAISTNATATDKVDYKNLQVGKKYTMKGTLMDKKTGKPVMSNGKPVTAETSFTPTSANGSVNVVFHFDDTKVAGDSLVAYEDLYDENNKKVASHDDINDKSETDTVEKPSIGTTLVGTNGHELELGKSVIATDTVAYTDLIPGKKYTMTGTLMDKKTGKPVMNNGKPVTASTTFTPEKANGSVNVVFHLDDTNYAGDSLVAYEDLTDENGTKIVSHDDINDQAETDTVEKPEIGTTLLGSNGTHVLPFGSNVTATDTVEYKDLIPGKKYTMKGTLMDKNTGKVVMENGKPVTAETTFTPTTANGTVKLTFTLNDEALAGDALVAYEDLYDQNGNEIVAHDDINDQAETDTVEVPTPSMGTTLVGSNGTHVLQIGEDTTAVDTVAYHNLIPGKQYKLVGTLMDKATGKPVMNNGKPVTATTYFTPTTPDGVATVTFHFNDKGYEGHALVAYEDLYDAKTGKLLLKHDDINDMNETATVKKPKKHTPMIQFQTQSQNVYVSSPASTPVVEKQASPAPVIESPAAPVVEKVASPAPAVQASPAPAQGKGVAQGQGLPETADTSAMGSEYLAAAAALAGAVMMFKGRRDENEEEA